MSQSTRRFSRTSSSSSSSTRGSNAGARGAYRGRRRDAPVNVRQVANVRQVTSMTDDRSSMSDEEWETCYNILLREEYFTDSYPLDSFKDEVYIASRYDSVFEGEQYSLVMINAKTQKVPQNMKQSITPGQRNIYTRSPLNPNLADILGVIVNLNSQRLACGGRKYTVNLIVPNTEDGQGVRYETVDGVKSLVVNALQTDISTLGKIRDGEEGDITAERVILGTAENSHLISNLGGMLVYIFQDNGKIFAANSSHISVFEDGAKFNGVDHRAIMERYRMAEVDLVNKFSVLFDGDNADAVLKLYIVDIHFVDKSRACIANPDAKFPPYIYKDGVIVAGYDKGRNAMWWDPEVRERVMNSLNKANIRWYEDDGTADSNAKDISGINEAIKGGASLVKNIKSAPSWVTIIHYSKRPDSEFHDVTTYTMCNIPTLRSYDAFGKNLGETFAVRLAEERRYLDSNGGRPQMLNTSLSYNANYRYYLTSSSAFHNVKTGQVIDESVLKNSVVNYIDGALSRFGKASQVLCIPWKLSVVDTTPAEDEEVSEITFSNAIVKTIHGSVHPQLHHVALRELLVLFDTVKDNFVTIYRRIHNRLQRQFLDAGNEARPELKGRYKVVPRDLENYIRDNGYELDQQSSNNYLVKVVLDFDLFMRRLAFKSPKSFSDIFDNGGFVSHKKNERIAEYARDTIDPTHLFKIGRVSASDDIFKIAELYSSTHSDRKVRRGDKLKVIAN